MRVTITTSSSGEPTAHKEGCRDLAKVRRRHDYCGEYTIDANTLTDVSLSFWSDIIYSDNGLEGAEAEAMAQDYLSGSTVPSTRAGSRCYVTHAQRRRLETIPTTSN